MTDLTRFHEAQQKISGGYAQALKEISAGKKTSHWVWYIFPQLNTIGQSTIAVFYGINDFEEACDYLRDPVLFKHYIEMVTLVEQHLKAGIPLETLMGSETDALKLVSSLTLFGEVASVLSSDEKELNKDFKTLKSSCDNIFTIIAQKGHYRCEKTLSYLKSALTHKDRSTPQVQDKKANAGKPVTESNTISGSSFFPPKTKPINYLPIPKTYPLLIASLHLYIKKRKEEWSFHFNFLGIMSVLYFIQDLLTGTDHFNSKHSEIKISAATKLKQILGPSIVKEVKPFTESEKAAFEDGRLGKLVEKYGGLDKLLKHEHLSELVEKQGGADKLLNTPPAQQTDEDTMDDGPKF